MKSNNSTLQIFGTRLKHFSTFIFVFHVFSAALSAREVDRIIPAAQKNMPTAFKSLASPLGTESMRINLYLLNANNTTILADGVLTEYNNLYHDSVTLEDAYKFTNIKENLGLNRYGCMLAVERRPVIKTLDTIYIKLWKTTMRSYQFEFVGINLNHPDMQGFLEDAYLGTRTPLELAGTTRMNFTVNNDSASGGINRFRIVYHAGFTGTTLPVTFASVMGRLSNSNIAVDWKVENEINIDRYEIEKSMNGTDFIKVGSMVIAKQNTAGNNYSWVDRNTVSGNNYYRIKSIERDGAGKFSAIVKVIAGKQQTGSIMIYPNPIKGSLINLKFTNQPTGTYQVRMINNNGQVVFSGKIAVTATDVTQAINTNRNLAIGMYQLEIKAPDNTMHVQQAMVQE